MFGCDSLCVSVSTRSVFFFFFLLFSCSAKKSVMVFEWLMSTALSVLDFRFEDYLF